MTKAEAGTPALVNFPPDTWPGGHFLIVSGGDETSVHLVDSSTLNMAVMSRSTFAKYWRGKAWTFTQEPYSVTGKPTLSVDFINQVLSAYGSPAAGKGQALYDLGVQYGIDPAYALAFFLHESTLGTQGEARITMSLGNLRCIASRPCVDKDRGGYAQMASWEDGFEVWYQLIKNYYVGKLGLITVDQIIPLYAPNADHNNEQGYIKALKHYVDTWQAGILRP